MLSALSTDGKAATREGMKMRQVGWFLSLLIAMLALAGPASAEDGYDLWLRYQPVEAAWQQRYDSGAASLVVQGNGPVLDAAAGELQRGVHGMLGHGLALAPSVGDGAIVIGTPAGSSLIAGLNLALEKLGKEGFLIRSVTIAGHRATVIAANSDVGVLYGVFRLLKLMQTRTSLDALDIADAPRLQLRVLDHWDNPTRYVERGYAGQSLWDWQTLPGYNNPRYTDYARADASIGINGVVLNNVNANVVMLTPQWLVKAKALADIFRPWGIRIYLSAKFSAPMELGGLKTNDPLDPQVAAWWKAKADEIYALIPDFGGFLVKANSEGQPGPQDYHRTHADGANMLADALAPHGGIVMWRAFVYASENPDDRAKQAYNDFQPLDGKFRPNVLVQIKNGPIDFQPREPFHPLFGAMPHTAEMFEVQLSKEYLGFATHLAYLGTMWSEALGAETGRGGTVADILETPVAPGALTGMAGAANAGTDRNWTGSQFNQANWYAFGRLAWDPKASAQDIALDWTRMTWGNDRDVVVPIVAMMMQSREAVVDYMTPLGLAHQMATGTHYGPGPWVSDLARPEWNPAYYNKADASGIGFDRTATGSNAIGQYAPQLREGFGNLRKTDEKFLLWFHHVPWDYRMKSGRTLWDELVIHYDEGVDSVRRMQADWASLKGKVDDRRWHEVTEFLAIQHDEAIWWRDASIAYFQSVSKRPLPAGHAAPAHDLDWYKAIKNPFAPGDTKPGL
jgi:alpha-glucuronidase